MLLLFESAAGLALLKVSESKLKAAEVLYGSGSGGSSTAHDRHACNDGVPSCCCRMRTAGTTLRAWRRPRRCASSGSALRPASAEGVHPDASLARAVSPPSNSPQVVKLKAFAKFENTAEALQTAASLVDSKLSKGAAAAAAPLAPFFSAERSLLSPLFSMGLQQPRPIVCTLQRAQSDARAAELGAGRGSTRA